MENTANSTLHDTVTSKTHEEPIQYVGFWRRSLASAIEWNLILLLALLLALPFIFLEQSSFVMFLLLCLFMNIAPIFFNLYLLKGFGATPGKFLLNMQVISLNESTLTYTQVFKRYSIYLLFFLLQGTLLISALINHLHNNNLNLTFMEELLKMGQTHQVFPYGNYINALLYICMFVDICVLIFYQKKRALHDFMAGTAVVYLPETSLKKDKHKYLKKALSCLLLTWPIIALLIFILFLFSNTGKGFIYPK